MSILIFVRGLRHGRGEMRVYTGRSGRLVRKLTLPCALGRRGVKKNKAEGDLATPSGVFGFGFAFGICADPGAKIKYIQLTDTMYFVDDVNSDLYNTLVDTACTFAELKSAEHMADFEGLYDYGLEIGFNKSCKRGAGSAIFMHCTENINNPTRGCIAIKKPIMKAIIKAVASDSAIAIF